MQSENQDKNCMNLDLPEQPKYIGKMIANEMQMRAVNSRFFDEAIFSWQVLTAITGNVGSAKHSAIA